MALYLVDLEFFWLRLGNFFILVNGQMMTKAKWSNPVQVSHIHHPKRRHDDVAILKGKKGLKPFILWWKLSKSHLFSLLSNLSSMSFQLGRDLRYQSLSLSLPWFFLPHFPPKTSLNRLRSILVSSSIVHRCILKEMEMMEASTKYWEDWN